MRLRCFYCFLLNDLLEICSMRGGRLSAWSSMYWRRLRGSLNCGKGAPSSANNATPFGPRSWRNRRSPMLLRLEPPAARTFNKNLGIFYLLHSPREFFYLSLFRARTGLQRNTWKYCTEIMYSVNISFRWFYIDSKI